MDDQHTYFAAHKIRPYVRNKRFFNHEHDKLKSFFTDTVLMFLRNRLTIKNICPKRSAQWIDRCDISYPERIEQKCEPEITWIGHSSFLIRCDGVTILTDPVFGNASFAYRRVLPAGILPHELPPVDIIVLSHNHRDHMDESSLLALRHHKNMRILVPLGDKAWFDRRNFSNVQEFTWWQQEIVAVERAQKEVRFTFLPAMHWSQRGLFDKNRSLWGSWMIEVGDWRSLNDHRACLYFAGDTSYSSHFHAIAQEFPSIDVAFMPIAPCEPRVWMNHVHLDAQQAGQAFLDLKARHFVPMHWGTFRFGLDYFDQPIEKLLAWWRHVDVSVAPHKGLHILKVGKRHTIPLFS